MRQNVSRQSKLLITITIIWHFRNHLGLRRYMVRAPQFMLVKGTLITRCYVMVQDSESA